MVTQSRGIGTDHLRRKLVGRQEKTHHRAHRDYRDLFSVNSAISVVDGLFFVEGLQEPYDTCCCLLVEFRL